MQCGSLSRQLSRAIAQQVCWCARSFSAISRHRDSVKPPEAIIDSSSSRIFLSSPIREGNNDNGESRRYIQAQVTAITPVQQSGSPGDDFKIEHLREKLKKVDLCKRYNLQPRDLGALEVDIVGRRAQIFVRPGTIVYAADVRAIIRRDKLLLFQNKQKEEDDKKDKEERADVKDQDEKDISSEQSEVKEQPDLSEQVMKEMRRISLQGRQTFGDGVAEGNPFEFIALEALLAQTAKGLFKTSDSLQERYANLMETLKVSDQIPTSALQQMLEIKDSVEEFKSTSEEFRQAVAEVLREEGDMAQMYLTDIHNGKPHTVGDDDEIELLLEMYRHHAYSLTDLATTLLTRLQSITNHVTLLLSSTRNRLLNLEITIAFTTLGTSVGGLIGALFGMNLTSGLEEAPYFFGGVSFLAIVLAAIIARWGRGALKRARSVKGEQEGLLRQSLPGLRRRFARVQAQKTMR